MYDKGNPSIQVSDWFKSRPVPKRQLRFDHCRLGMDALTFVLGKVGDDDWKKIVGGNSDSSVFQSSLAIVEPISFTLDIGIENSVLEGDLPHTCVEGDLPSISFQISPSQINRMLSVIKKWKDFAETMQGKILPSSLADETEGLFDDQ
eukprot:15334379-Ditylum_brightwellii.AAC.1